MAFIEELRARAEEGDRVAMATLAWLYDHGEHGVAEAKELAVLWYRRAAEQGEPTAQCSLAICYELGLGVEADLAQARQWYEKAAQQGDLQAMYNLATMCLDGEGRRADGV